MPQGIAPATASFHYRYLQLVDQVERNFPVVRWKIGDMEVWPLARMQLYLDMYRANAGDALPKPSARPLPLRVAARVATPVRNLWTSRRDLAHCVTRPRPADAIFLGDGVSLDRVDGQWRDRFAEPLIAALERRGRTAFVIEGGNLGRLPWHRPTYAGNLIEARGFLTALGRKHPGELPEHEGVLEFLAGNGVQAPSLSRPALERFATTVLATATAFERVLRIVKPKLAFVVTYYSGLGPAFLLACRRQGILSVDLQHCAQEGAHKAYCWSSLPATGYSTLPAVCWNWTEADAAYNRGWASRLPLPWHSALHGGHTQLVPFLDANDPTTRMWDARFSAIGGGVTFEREILIALQPIHGHRGIWNSLASQIEAAPSTWRWWIRRHPATAPLHDSEYQCLLALRRPNVLIEEASSLPLPALLRHMSVLLSVASGAAEEASMFGVPAFFLSEEARSPFGNLIEKGCAAIIDIHALEGEIWGTPRAPHRPGANRAPDPCETLLQLESMARDYAQLCQSVGRGSIQRGSIERRRRGFGDP